MAHKSEIYDAIEKLAEAMGVDVGIVIEAVEDGFKSAYKKYIRRNQVPTNISVAVTREHDIQVLARKVVSEEITDDLMQISLEEARKFSPEYQLGDILEIRDSADSGYVNGDFYAKDVEAEEDAGAGTGVLAGMQNVSATVSITFALEDGE